MKRLCIAFLLLGSFASAQTLQRIEFAAHVTAASLDAAQTCYVLSQPHTHEDFLPTQSCATAVGLIAVQVAGEEFLAHELDKHHHRKLAHVVRWLSIGDSMSGVVYTWRNYKW